MGIKDSFVRQQFLELVYDIVTVLIISLLVTFEFLLFFLTYLIKDPTDNLKKLMDAIRQRMYSRWIRINRNDEISTITEHCNRIARHMTTATSDQTDVNSCHQGDHTQALQKNGFLPIQSLQLIRLPLFLTVFAESLSLSFLPLFVEQLYSPLGGISKQLVLALPISVFMLFWTFSLLPAGILADRMSKEKIVATGAFVTVIGHLLTGLSQNVYQILIFRSIAALGFGTVFIATQGYITDRSSKTSRTRDLATFQSGYFSGALCGAAIGGILADRIGYAGTFFFSAFIALTAGILIIRFFQMEKPPKNEQQSLFQWKNFLMLSRNFRFMLLLFMAAIPAKICLTAFYYYTVPLYLRESGFNRATIGRFMVIYSLLQIILPAVAGRWADKTGNRRVFVESGGYLSGLGLLLVFWFPNAYGVLAAIALLGLAHSLSVSSQLSLIPDICRKESNILGQSTIIGVFRFMEKIGSIAGPLLAGLFISRWGFPGSIAATGIISLVSMMIFTFFFRSGVTETEVDPS